MKTIEIKLYSFDEPSEEAKDRARNDYRNKGIDCSYNYDEAHESVKKFNDVFRTKEGCQSWLDVRFDNITNEVCDMSGLRLRKYIINNFWSDIHRGAYKTVNISDKKVIHKRVTSKYFERTKRWHNAYWSAITLDRCCPFTGVCWDDDLLKPIFNLIDWKEDYSSLTFEELMDNCMENLKKSLESEDDYRNSDESIDEELEDNNYDFTENDKIY